MRRIIFAFTLLFCITTVSHIASLTSESKGTFVSEVHAAGPTPPTGGTPPTGPTGGTPPTPPTGGTPPTPPVAVDPNLAVPLLVPIPNTDGAGGTTTVIDGRITGSILFDYLSILYRWTAGIIGTVAILMIIISGFMMIIASGNQQLVDEAKSRIVHAAYGLVLLITSALVLWTLNPGFFGNVRITQTSSTPSGAVSTTPPLVPTVATTRVCNISPQLKSLAQYLLNATGDITFEQGSSAKGLTDSGSKNNLTDIVNGKCPLTERQHPGCESPGSNRGPETDPPTNTSPFLGSAQTVLQGLKALADSPEFDGMYISSLFGGNHTCEKHRQLSAFDVSNITPAGGSPTRVVNMTKDQICTLAQKVLTVSGATFLQGPLELTQAPPGGCGFSSSQYKGDNTVHDNHFHVGWGTPLFH